jgi:thioredoxin 1
MVQGGYMADLYQVTEDTFKTEVVDSDQPVLVDFSAVWCGPCKMLDPIIKQLADEWKEKVKVVKIDADQSPGILEQYGVMGIPTLMLFKSGQVRERLTGYLPKDKLLAKLSSHL